MSINSNAVNNQECELLINTGSSVFDGDGTIDIGTGDGGNDFVTIGVADCLCACQTTIDNTPEITDRNTLEFDLTGNGG